jgi:hypothetical protein
LQLTEYRLDHISAEFRLNGDVNRLSPSSIDCQQSPHFTGG